MSSRYDVGAGYLEGAIYFRPTFVTPADLTPEGVLILNNDLPEGVSPWVILEPGTVLHGVSVRDGGVDATSAQEGRYIILTCGPGDGFATLIHESPQVLDDPADRFRINGGNRAFTYVDRRPLQIYFDSAAVRWMAPDWTGTFLHVYESDGVAFERIATLADLGEGQGVGVNAQVTMLAEAGGVAYSTTIDLRGSGRRPTGGSTARDFTTSSDGGNLPGALVELEVVGNAIALRVTTTYVGTVTVTWNQSVRPSPLVYAPTSGVAEYSLSNAGAYVGADGDYPATQQATSGTGSGATFAVSVTGGVVTAAAITAIGSGYAVGDTITLAVPALTENTAAVVTVDYATS